jgi:Methyltransferase involved in Williams-Beuren syndrome
MILLWHAVHVQTPSGVAVVGRQKGSGGGKRGKKGAGGHNALSARHPESKGKAWIHRKKDAMRAKGYLNVPHDSKYTGRKRKTRF